jgi:hypothetical protein
MMLRVFAAAATLAALLSPAAAQCIGVECCTAEEVLRHQCTGSCYNPLTGVEERCLTEDSTCSECLAALTPPITIGYNTAATCSGTPTATPVRSLSP